ncbi:MAG: hypothetical protein JSR33_07355 [Proteobacteria bacterium]|nr:hypothetical protein [Pseudomonadota bacterium]
MEIRTLLRIKILKLTGWLLFFFRCKSSERYILDLIKKQGIEVINHRDDDEIDQIW